MLKIFEKEFIAIQIFGNQYMLKIKHIELGKENNSSYGNSKKRQPHTISNEKLYSEIKSKNEFFVFRSVEKIYEKIYEELIKEKNIFIDTSEEGIAKVSLKPGKINVKKWDFKRYYADKNIYRNQTIKSINFILTKPSAYIREWEKAPNEFKDYLINKIKEDNNLDTDIKVSIPISNCSCLSPDISKKLKEYTLINEIKSKILDDKSVLIDSKFDDVFFVLEDMKYNHYKYNNKVQLFKNLDRLIDKEQHKKVILKYIPYFKQKRINYSDLGRYTKKTILFDKKETCSNEEIKSKAGEVFYDYFDENYKYNNVTTFEYNDDLIICFYKIKTSNIKKLRENDDIYSLESTIENELEAKKKEIIKQKIENDRVIQELDNFMIKNSYDIHTDERSIDYFTDYEPMKVGPKWQKIMNLNHSGASAQIIELKKGNLEAVDYFYKRIRRDFLLSKKLFKDMAITVVPSHEANKEISGMTILVDKICTEIGFENACGLIKRYKTIKKKSYGGSRDKEKERESLIVNDKIILESKKILIFDDVTTTGNSLEVCKKLLEDNGYEEVYVLALAKTVDYRRRSRRNYDEWYI